ncbi:alpha-ketoacid dehydrogenase subunit beta [Aliidongia dinghuensis]|nr:transketolase C-terminal domain-containing protein [Aliidongia dinghuensis]
MTMIHNGLPAQMSYREALAHAMHSALDQHDNTIIIGQGVTDFKGIFGTVLGLAETHPSRVIETPLAEDSVTGICIGAALNGVYPINIHIRADFGLLAANQLINLAAKYKYMFGGLFNVPMMVRMVIGRSWGQGAQHSQSLQSLFAHIPGLVVLMPSTPEAIVSSYAHAIAHHAGPVIMLEHRLMYDLVFETARQATVPHPFGSRVERSGGDVTIVATSIMVLEARRAAAHLAAHGIDCEIIDLHSISHPDHQMILDSIAKTGRLVVADTSWQPYGVSAEICRIVAERDPRLLKAPVVTLGMAPAPCPTAKALEDMYYPDLHVLVDATARLVRGREDHGVPILDAKSMTDFYKHFKGPF